MEQEIKPKTRPNKLTLPWKFPFFSLNRILKGIEICP